MIQYFAVDLVLLLNRLSLESDRAWINDNAENGDASQVDRQRVLVLLNEVEQHCEKVELVKIKGRLKPFKSQLESSERCSYHIMDHELDKLRDVIAEEIKDRIFTYIPPNKVQYFEQSEAFGAAVHATFPDARRDIKAACNCLSADLNTAAVFHLVRTTEYGMRALAKKLRAKTAFSLEYCDWSQVLGAIERKLDAIKQKSRGRKKSEQWEHYSRALSDGKALLETRNRVSHARDEFSEPEALGVFNRAKDLMQHLSQVV